MKPINLFQGIIVKDGSFSNLKGNYKYILPVIIFSQFFCTSLWFAGNAVLSDLVIHFGISENALGYLSSSVQLGFIIGALVFAILCIADRFSPSKVFLVCSVFAALFNLGIVWSGNGLTSILVFRFLTGFFLAGIYPVGMKIASDYFEKGLGKSLSYLVGALVLGTALPHLLKDFPALLDYEAVIKTTSALAVSGGMMMFVFVPDGPFRKFGSKPDFSAFFSVFRNKKFRSAAFGYFGHMWELYAFWTFVPVMLITYKEINGDADYCVALFSFIVIGVGAISCAIGGQLAAKYGNRKIAIVSLTLSFLCCIFLPLMFKCGPVLFLTYLIFWGMVVIADSPLFSAMVASNADSENKGTGLTIVTCIGFAITIISIQLLNGISATSEHVAWMYVVLAIGPFLGLMSLTKTKV